jgi:hypothetical protein
MSKYVYTEDVWKTTEKPPSRQWANSCTRWWKVNLPEEEGRYIGLTTWLGGCGLALIDQLYNWQYNDKSTASKASVKPYVDLVEDILKDITLNHKELRLNSNWPVKDVYFTLAFAQSTLKIGDTFGEFTKLINIHLNKAHGPNSIYTFHSSHP